MSSTCKCKHEIFNTTYIRTYVLSFISKVGTSSSSNGRMTSLALTQTSKLSYDKT